MENMKLPPRPTYYVFSNSTGEFIGTGIAEYDVLHLHAADEVRYMLPGFATWTEPPSREEGKAAVWKPEGSDPSVGAWTTVPDFRNQTWYRGAQPVHIDRFGDPAEAGFTKEPVLPPPDPVDERRQQKAEVQMLLAEVVTRMSSYVASGDKVPDDLKRRRDALNVELDELDRPKPVA